jgi:hypothetical protein
MSTYTVRPLSDRTWLRPASQRTRSRFTTTWSDTLRELNREINHLGGRNVVFEIDVQEHHIRNDGMLRADARPADPAVVVAFESKHGPLLYRSDQYARLAYGSKAQHPWQDNVRAITLTLQALRAVDRYGATETGQQYTGFKALPAGQAMPASHMTRTAAAELLERVAIGDEGASRERQINRILEDSTQAREVWREARKVAHPDRRGGDHSVWDQVEQAARVLGVAR